MSVLPLPPSWTLTRRNPRNEPIGTFTRIDGMWLQVYRYIARPNAWTAYAPGILGDVILAANDLEAAQAEALALLSAHRRSRAGARARDHAD